jgi:hypothetical protein
MSPKVYVVSTMMCAQLNRCFHPAEYLCSKPKKPEQDIWKVSYERLKQQDSNMAEGHTSDIDALLLFVSIYRIRKNGYWYSDAL